MILLIIIGFLTALLAGLGLGGGVLLIPALVFVCGINQFEAQFYSLITYIPMAIAALTVHIRTHSIAWKELLLLLPSGLLGAGSGAFLARAVPVEKLRIVYGVFLIAFGIHLIFDLFKKDIYKQKTKI